MQSRYEETTQELEMAQMGNNGRKNDVRQADALNSQM